MSWKVLWVFSLLLVFPGAATGLDGLIFASTHDPLLCLGLRDSASLTLVDCDDKGVGVLWNRSQDNAKAYGQLTLLVPGRPCAAVQWPGGPEQLLNASLALGDQNETLVQGSSAHATSTACTAGWEWRLDETLRLEVRPLHSGDVPGWPNGSDASNWCLHRLQQGAGAQIALAACNASLKEQQQWLPLVRGSGNPNARLAEVSFPLRSQGRHLVDAAGRVVRLRGTNWYGAHMEQKVFNGLDRQPLKRIVRLMKHLGFNSMRLNYAVQMWLDHARGIKDIPFPQFLTGNPQLYNRTVFEVFDAVVKEVTSQGLLVVLNAHTNQYRWCCSLDDEQGLWWNKDMSEGDFFGHLTGIAARYASNPRVIGFDPRNEPRPNHPDGDGDNPILIWWDTTVWGGCIDVTLKTYGVSPITLGHMSQAGVCLPEHTADWRIGATQSAYAIWHGNPDALVFIEGTGGADLTRPFASPPPFKQLCLDSRVVWSVHDYSWFWKWMELNTVLSSGGPGGMPSFERVFGILESLYTDGAEKDVSYENYEKSRDFSWGFMLNDNHAPVWIGEFGDGGADGVWWNHFLQYAKEKDLDWCYWSLDGVRYPKGMVIDGGYMSGSQRLDSGPDGFAEDSVDAYGLVRTDYVGLKSPEQMLQLISIQAPVLSDVVGAQPPGTCTFDPELHPITGTLPHPRGFRAYMDTGRTCQNRHLQEDPQVFAASGGHPQNNNLHRRLSKSSTSKDKERERMAAKVAADSGTQRIEACKAEPLATRPREPGSLIKEARLEQGTGWLVDVALRRSTSLQQLRAELGHELDDKMEQLRIGFITLGVIIPFLLLLMFILGLAAWRPKTKPWLAPLALLSHAVEKGIWSRSPWQPPVSLAKAKEGLRAWRPFLLFLFLALTLGILLAASWGLEARSLILSGVDDSRCTALTSVDWVLNGHDKFIGILPALQVADVLLANLALGSNFWASFDTFLDKLNTLPDDLQSLRIVIDALDDDASQTHAENLGNSTNSTYNSNNSNNSNDSN
eukprot:CAMPEP_0115061628 /NCGR_PEP_ID=MMETSP0227-20121206/8107_1 /TAXON_ID=89957 /ORGANISM="Polarella glacialis, Strain CCMP 1383" /LENGTH=1013 /DNA_ID=CAMNT_0002446939 /DNA_START=129 /DNA_END=3168 /DNA_ORIENTATION=-